MGGIIVVADTHFGIKKGSISMPGYFADFFKVDQGAGKGKGEESQDP